MAAGIEHRTAVSEMGLVPNFDRRQFDHPGPFARQGGCWQQLAQTLERIKYPGRRASGNIDAIGCD